MLYLSFQQQRNIITELMNLVSPFRSMSLQSKDYTATTVTVSGHKPAVRNYFFNQMKGVFSLLSSLFILFTGQSIVHITVTDGQGSICHKMPVSNLWGTITALIFSVYTFKLHVGAVISGMRITLHSII